MSKPLVPEDLGNGQAASRALFRSIAARVLAKIHGGSPERLARASWPQDRAAVALITRGAVSPLDTVAGAAFVQTRITDLLLGLAPGSAAAQLFARSLRFDFEGVLQYQVPHIAIRPVPLFVGESAPIPVVQPGVASSTIGPTRKLSFIAAISRELASATPETMSVVLARLLGESAAKALDLAVFGNAAASTLQPAGLLNGVVALTATAAGSSPAIDIVASDIAALATAFATAGINSADMILILNPAQAWKLRTIIGYQNIEFTILMSLGVPAGTVIAVVPSAIGSGYEGAPEIEITDQPALHFDASVPLELVSGSGAVASPSMSTWQQDLLAVKLRTRCAWSALQPGCVQTMGPVNW
jgi:hypothetical protein